jgi:uncharacterized phage protein (TIGR01671 family)
MIYKIGVYSDGTAFCDNYDDHVLPLNMDRNILMQYTGLKDKNKKEIFEGDILKSILSYNGKEKILIVYWSEPVAGFMLNDINHSFGWEFGLSFRTLEVIGNIYENPELLK